jgi:hypothetical protein
MAKKKSGLGLTASSLSSRLGGAFEGAEKSALMGEPSRRKGIGGTALTDDTAKNRALRIQQGKDKRAAKLETPSETAGRIFGKRRINRNFAPTYEELPFEKSESMPTLGALVEAAPKERLALMRAALAMRSKK